MRILITFKIIGKVLSKKIIILIKHKIINFVRWIKIQEINYCKIPQLKLNYNFIINSNNQINTHQKKSIK
jgi:hypothetical protein